MKHLHQFMAGKPAGKGPAGAASSSTAGRKSEAGNHSNQAGKIYSPRLVSAGQEVSGPAETDERERQRQAVEYRYGGLRSRPSLRCGVNSG